MGEVKIIVPRVVNGKIGMVDAVVSHEQWTSADSKLENLLSMIHLPSGHHGDRDLELARIAAQALGGEVSDTRAEPKNLGKMPK